MAGREGRSTVSSDKILLSSTKMIKIYFSLLSHVERLDLAVHLVEEELQGEEATTEEGAAKGLSDLVTESSLHKYSIPFFI